MDARTAVRSIVREANDLLSARSTGGARIRAKGGAHIRATGGARIRARTDVARLSESHQRPPVDQGQVDRTDHGDAA